MASHDGGGAPYSAVFDRDDTPEEWRVFTELAVSVVAAVNDATMITHPLRRKFTDTQDMAIAVLEAAEAAALIGPGSCERARHAALNTGRHGLGG